MFESLHSSIIAYQTMGIIAIAILTVIFVCVVSVIMVLCSDNYKKHMHSKKMLELEKEKEDYVEEYKQLVKELREKVEKA